MLGRGSQNRLECSTMALLFISVSRQLDLAHGHPNPCPRLGGSFYVSYVSADRAEDVQKYTDLNLKASLANQHSFGGSGMGV